MFFIDVLESFRLSQGNLHHLEHIAPKRNSTPTVGGMNEWEVNNDEWEMILHDVLHFLSTNLDLPL